VFKEIKIRITIEFFIGIFVYNFELRRYIIFQFDREIFEKKYGAIRKRTSLCGFSMIEKKMVVIAIKHNTGIRDVYINDNF
jgi:hypothetical protein